MTGLRKCLEWKECNGGKEIAHKTRQNRRNEQKTEEQSTSADAGRTREDGEGLQCRCEWQLMRVGGGGAGAGASANAGEGAGAARGAEHSDDEVLMVDTRNPSGLSKSRVHQAKCFKHKLYWCARDWQL